MKDINKELLMRLRNLLMARAETDSLLELYSDLVERIGKEVKMDTDEDIAKAEDGEDNNQVNVILNAKIS